jgi:hypothetical protein
MNEYQRPAEMVIRALNDHNVERILQCYSPDAVFVSPFGVAEGHEQIAWYLEHLITSFPDVTMTAWHRVLCGDPRFIEWTMTGTHTGPFLLPDGEMAEGTGRRITLRGCGACAVENGKIVTHRDYFDQLELYSQLGFSLVSPTPPGA